MSNQRDKKNEAEREGLAVAIYNTYVRRGFTYEEMREAIKQDFQEIKNEIKRLKLNKSKGGE